MDDFCLLFAFLKFVMCTFFVVALFWLKVCF